MSTAESTAADIGIIGVGVMGRALAQNFHSRGNTVALWENDTAKRDGLRQTLGAKPENRYVIADSLQGFVSALDAPRRILMMVPAGTVVDLVLDQLTPLLDREDIVIDGGNSHFADTDRRAARDDFRFVGMGVSGGEEGALKGPSMMPGGDAVAWERLRPVLESAAAVSDSGPCVDYCGRASAGHFVKMVHNGIEYGDMQLIAETHQMMRHGMGMSPREVADTFARWNEGPLESYLIEITAQIAGSRDPAGDGPLVDQILDVAGQKGTGRWTSISAIELGVALPTVTGAVDARVLSAGRSVRLEAAAAFDGAGGQALSTITVDDLEAALYAAKIMSYTQGFALLRDASEERDYGTDLARMARIWKAGCIIRARFLDRVYDAFRERADLPLLLLDASFAADVRSRLPAWRKVVGAAVTAGWPVPCLSASLAYFDTLIRAEGSANVIQAQRDFFGAHTYRRRNAPEVAVHTAWDTLEQL